MRGTPSVFHHDSVARQAYHWDQNRHAKKTAPALAKIQSEALVFFFAAGGTLRVL
jgi:hypothetical protein